MIISWREEVDQTIPASAEKNVAPITCPLRNLRGQTKILPHEILFNTVYSRYIRGLKSRLKVGSKNYS